MKYAIAVTAALNLGHDLASFGDDPCLNTLRRIAQ